MTGIRPSSEWKDGIEGMFLLSEKVYRGATGISQSDLKLAVEDPDLINQRKARPMEPSRPMILGTLVHMGILEPKAFKRARIVEPSTYTDDKGIVKPWNNNATVCKEWHQKRQHKTVLSRDENATVLQMIAAFTEHPEGALLLEHGHREVAVFTRHESGLMLKGRIDILFADEEQARIVDIKCTADGTAFGFGSAAADFRYDMQNAFYRRLLAEHLATAPPVFVNCTIEFGGSHFVRWIFLDNESLSVGQDDVERAIEHVRFAMETNKWSRMQVATLPKWAKRLRL